MKKITIQFRPDGPKASIEPLIDELIHLHREWDVKAESGVASDESLPRVQTITAQILDWVIWNPGNPIYYQDREKLDEAQQVIEWLWKDHIDEGLFNKVLVGVEDGDTLYSSIGVELVGTYSDRVKELRPISISVDLPPEVKGYYREAMKAWVRGLDSAALILCWSVLDEVIRQTLVPKLAKGSFKDFRLVDSKNKKADIIAEAEQSGVLERSGAKKARKIRHLRNQVLHDRKIITGPECHEVIVETKLVLESLFTKG